MQLARREILKSLKRKGFAETPGKSRNHTFLAYHDLSGQKTAAFTLLSRGSQHRSIGPGLVTTMAEQCKLNKEQFVLLVRCPMSREDYNRLVANTA